jgi:hypothetical protein
VNQSFPNFCERRARPECNYGVSKQIPRKPTNLPKLPKYENIPSRHDRLSRLFRVRGSGTRRRAGAGRISPGRKSQLTRRRRSPRSAQTHEYDPRCSQGIYLPLKNHYRGARENWPIHHAFLLRGCRSASWGGGSGTATGWRGGTASWGGGSGSFPWGIRPLGLMETVIRSPRRNFRAFRQCLVSRPTPLLLGS